MNKKIIGFTQSIAFFAALIAVWYTIVQSGVWSPYVLPSPESVWEYLVENTGNGKIPNAILVTLGRLLIGYAIGLLIGIPAGLLMAKFKFLNRTLGVLALGLQALPSVCWVPLACIWFGQTETALLFVVVMGTLWSVILSTENGIRHISPIYSQAAKTMGASSWYTLIHVTLPASAPYIVSGMKQGWAFAWRSLMAAEIYVVVISGFGIGQYLHYGRELQRMNQVIGIMFVIIFIGLVADKTLFSPIERRLHRKWGTGLTSP